MPDEHLEWLEDQEFVNPNRFNWNLRRSHMSLKTLPLIACTLMVSLNLLSVIEIYEGGNRRPEAYLIQTDSLYSSKFS